MLTAEQIKSFDRQGFLQVPALLTNSQVATLRRDLESLFNQPVKYEGDLQAHGDRGSIRCDIFARYPEFRWLLIHPPLREVLASLLGDDFAIIPEIAAHASGYGDWHRDLTSHEKAGFKYSPRSSLKMVTVAVYLQDNNELGGGLDVVPGSHRRYRRYRRFHDKLKVYEQKFRLWISTRILRDKVYSIPGKAGDLVIFDCKIKHKASWPKVPRKSDDPTKFAIFLTCCVNNQEMRRFVSHLSTLDGLGYVKGHKYPDDLLSLTRSHRLNLVEFESS